MGEPDPYMYAHEKGASYVLQLDGASACAPATTRRIAGVEESKIVNCQRVEIAKFKTHSKKLAPDIIVRVKGEAR